MSEEEYSLSAYEESDDESYNDKSTMKQKVKNRHIYKKKGVVERDDSTTDVDADVFVDKPHLKHNDVNLSFKDTHEPILTSDSSDTEQKSSKIPSSNSQARKPNSDLKLKELSHHHTNIGQKKLPELDSDSEEDMKKNVKRKIRKNVIQSDTDSHSDNEDIIDSTDDSETLGIHSKDNLSTTAASEIEDITSKLNKSRISNEFNFGKKGNIINSTVLDIENTPGTPPISSKRLLNRSADTPRIIKQMKDSITPKNIPLPKGSASTLNNSFLTPRNVRPQIPSRSPSPTSDNSIEIVSEDDDVIDISSEERNSPVRMVVPPRINNKLVKQTTLDAVVIKKNVPSAQETSKNEVGDSNVLEVSPSELQAQKERVRQIETDLLRANNLMRTINMANLPDKGQLLKDKHAATERMLRVEAQKLSKMIVTKDNPHHIQDVAKNKVAASWDEIEAKADAVLPKTFGKRAMSTYNAQKAVTMDRLQQLHGSLESCPNEDSLAEDPKGLKVALMPHQKRALAWLMWREKAKAFWWYIRDAKVSISFTDDMGLGKTLTMISLMLKTMETKIEDDEDSENENAQKSKTKYNGGTLVVCPASLINQWSGELERRTKRGLASWELYHGPKRQTNAKKLAEYDMVITTYSIVMNEYDKTAAIFRVNWRRIIIDEGHQIRNYKSQTSIAICHLSAKSRWVLTGTPVHNKELDMYALLKFLRCTPFDDLVVWKRWVGDKSTGGQERLHTVISSLMLRRTKAELIEKGSLTLMPSRQWELFPVELDKNEMDIYQRILIFSRTLFAQFLHQRAEKNQDVADLKYANFNTQAGGGVNEEYFKMRQKLLHLHKVRDIKQHEILVLLLRLRQICCHPSLITGMLHEDMEDVDGGEHEELNILDQLNKLALDDDKVNPNVSDPALGLGSQEDAPGLKEAARGLLNPSNPVFSKQRLSSKIKVMLGVLKEKVIPNNDKAIVVSQWPSFLNLIAYHLKQDGIAYDQLDGSIPVHKRMVMVDSFNDPKDKMRVLLLSLTAGGVGLNLIGANHLFLLDLHWNPQLENQAQDRIYRVGQLKSVFVYKFMATDTIEKKNFRSAREETGYSKLNVDWNQTGHRKQIVLARFENAFRYVINF
ncbi:hypothetical protein NQ318_020463 [Aromia moschata]|uniref:Transcription termination factor 2 n=1 Tax=Aromia moschata TaxID=1265417 RepID=A0AAV8YJC4_9CUCU|nr:hypothetical protein NQ318_020463 [Aromia moschata]